MERSLAVVWTCLLGAGLVLALPLASSVTTSKASPRPPKIIDCWITNDGNATCRWTPGDIVPTKYTLKVQRMPGLSSITKSSLKILTCISTSTSCTVGISTRIDFCATITADSGGRDIRPYPPHCTSARAEMQLPPVILDSVNPVFGLPHCLSVIWSRDRILFPVSDPEIKARNLDSQIEFTAQGQLLQVKNVVVTAYRIRVCLFRPDTEYIIRLRHRYQGRLSPWSPWSKARQGRTGESAPSAAPELWRQVKQAGRDGWRLITLLWKPLPNFLANGRVLFYNVTCQTDDARVLSDRGSCRELHRASTSCRLPLPARRCSCALTASTSAGKSPEARLWLPGASDTELPSTGPITASPLNGSSFRLTWSAPVSRPVSGFAVEWFAVGEKNGNILHWEKLNSSSTTLVITEGVEPMERYAVSVTALYGELGAGKNRMCSSYTQQGAPSAGPDVNASRISGSTVELSWSPVPVELLRGFIRSYTVKYTAKNQPSGSVSVAGDHHHHTLNLSPGHYDISVQAVTDAGTGPAGTSANVHIGPEEISVGWHVVLPLSLASLALVLLMVCLAQSKTVKERLCRDTPDPSHSSLSHWAPKTTLESTELLVVPEKPEIQLAEELQDPDPDPYHSCHSYPNLRTPSSHQSSLLPVTAPEFLRRSTKAKTASGTDLATCPSIYSTVVFSQPLKNLPTPLLHPPCYESNDWNDGKLQQGGASDPAELHLPPTAEQKTFFLQRHQNPVSFSDFSAVSRPSVLPSHPAEVTSPKQSSFLSPNPNTFTRPAPFPLSSSPFHHSVSVDFSYCPVECDPYIPSDA